jgi:hypothetical protein
VRADAVEKPDVDVDANIKAARMILMSAVETKAADGDAVVDSLLTLEKSMRVKVKADPEVAKEMLRNLDGAWRLVCVCSQHAYCYILKCCYDLYTFQEILKLKS